MVIAVHGVGGTASGAMTRGLLVGAQIRGEVKEFCWNEFAVRYGDPVANIRDAVWRSGELGLDSWQRAMATAIEWGISVAALAALALAVLALPATLTAVQLVDLPVAAFAVLIKTLLLAAVIASACLIGAGTVVSPLHPWGAFHIGTRRIVFAWLRPVSVAFVLPRFLPVAAAVLLVPLALAGVTVVAGGLLGSFLTVLTSWIPNTSGRPDDIALDPWSLVNRGAWMSFQASAAFALTWVLALVIVSGARPLIKIILDIALYLGDADYRAKMQAEFDRVLRSQPRLDSRDVVLLTHSLGTVIVLDWLLNSGVAPMTRSLTFVTMGSPIRRLMFRYFPDVLFPRNVGAIANALRAKHGTVKWINIFRPFDQIGASLGLSRAGAGQDVSTRQWNRLLSAHTDYWSDGYAIGLALQGSEAAVVSPRPDQRGGRRTWYIPSPSREAGSSTVPWKGAVVLVTGLFVFGIVHTRAAIIERDNALISGVHNQLLRDGVAVEAGATYVEWIQAGVGEAPDVRMERVVFDLRDGSQGTRTIMTGDRKPVGASTYTDVAALFDSVRGNCRYERERYWLEVPSHVPCVAARTFRLTVLPEPEKHFEIEGFAAPSPTPVGHGVLTALFVLFGVLYGGLAFKAVASTFAPPDAPLTLQPTGRDAEVTSSLGRL